MSSGSPAGNASVSRAASPTAHFAAKWRQMVGIALLWVAISAALYVPQAAFGQIWVALLGFMAFATGLSLFAEGCKRDIVATLRASDQD